MDKKAVLVTYDMSTGEIVKKKIVLVPEDWHEFLGPYHESIPFCVNGNQQIHLYDNDEEAEKIVNDFNNQFDLFSPC